MADGPMEAWLAFPSRLPVYVFDANGRLVHGSPDAGDDPRFQHIWPRYE
ncbi:MAG: hypothetical protein IPM18_05000 [Phycisphaerales bacterium]|nr:hypothetical protein [Phycisphaerales bacterium]